MSSLWTRYLIKNFWQRFAMTWPHPNSPPFAYVCILMDLPYTTKWRRNNWEPPCQSSKKGILYVTLNLFYDYFFYTLLFYDCFSHFVINDFFEKSKTSVEHVFYALEFYKYFWWFWFKTKNRESAEKRKTSFSFPNE